jgi:serine/threonine protein kinase/Flp pilus assembly protein TadD
MSEQSIFTDALDRHDPAERAALLDRECGTDTDMRRRVERLLLRHEQPGPSLLDSPPRAIVALAEAREAVAAAAAASAERPGSVIGRYKLLELIGEGGFGIVFRAEQIHPVHRLVALKVIRPGMDTRRAIARFEAERQALALMDHDHIAKVLDAGATDSGRPYFVMELVRGGIPITQYCERHRLSPQQRLELFVAVCGAVQHAHTKGVIHRDLKPTNILVAEHDGVAVPKVIDFGTAKALREPLVDHTLYTTAAQVVGTPLYMAPEQAEAGAGPVVDTRSDVYALGAVLYELVSGSPPFDGDRLRGAAYDELRRIIREEDPPPPSSRVTGAAAPAGAAAPGAARPAPAFSKELDWIVLTAMEKVPDRRYQTAGALAADLRRYLNDEPVSACPPSAAYRLRKWAGRNKAIFVASSAAAVLVVSGVVALAVSNARIRKARTHAEAAQHLAEERASDIRRGLEDLQAANVLLERGRWYASQSRWDDAEAAFTKAIALRPDHASAWGSRGDLYAQLGLWDLAAPDVAREFKLCEPDNAARWVQHALLRLAVGDDAGCRGVARRARERFDGSIRADFTHDLVRVCLLASMSDGSGGREAERTRAEGRRLVRLTEALVEHYPGKSYSLLLLGMSRANVSDFEGAIGPLRDCLDSTDWEPRYMASPSLAIAYHHLGRTTEARLTLDDVAEVQNRWNEALESATRGGSWIVDYGAVAAWPVPWWDWLELDLRSQEASRQLGGAPAPDARVKLLRARAFAGLRRSDRAVAEYEAAVSLAPADTQVLMESHRARGFHFASQERWPDSVAEYAKACDLLPGDINLWRFRAITEFLAGDEAACRRSCAAVVARFGRTTDTMTACRVLEVCTMFPGAVPDPTQLLPVAERARRQWHYGPWVRGAALYRAGEYSAAVECLDRMQTVHHLRAWEQCFLAMAHHRLGHADDAVRWLSRAERWMEAADRREGDSSSGTVPAWGDWPERPVCRLLLAEASKVVNGPRL